MFATTSPSLKNSRDVRTFACTEKAPRGPSHRERPPSLLPTEISANPFSFLATWEDSVTSWRDKREPWRKLSEAPAMEPAASSPEPRPKSGVKEGTSLGNFAIKG